MSNDCCIPETIIRLCQLYFNLKKGWGKSLGHSLIEDSVCGKAGGGLSESRVAYVIGLGSMFGLLWLVLGWKQGLKLEKLAVLVRPGKIATEVIWFSSLDWLLLSLWVRALLSHVVWLLSVCIIRFSWSSWSAFIPQVFTEGLLRVPGTQGTAVSRADQTSWPSGAAHTMLGTRQSGSPGDRVLLSPPWL